MKVQWQVMGNDGARARPEARRVSDRQFGLPECYQALEPGEEMQMRSFKAAGFEVVDQQ